MKSAEFFHECGRRGMPYTADEVRIFAVGHHKKRFDVFFKLVIGESHLKFVLKIRHCAQSAHNYGGVFLV